MNGDAAFSPAGFLEEDLSSIEDAVRAEGHLPLDYWLDLLGLAVRGSAPFSRLVGEVLIPLLHDRRETIDLQLPFGMQVHLRPQMVPSVRGEVSLLAMRMPHPDGSFTVFRAGALWEPVESGMEIRWPLDIRIVQAPARRGSTLELDDTDLVVHALDNRTETVGRRIEKGDTPCVVQPSSPLPLPDPSTRILDTLVRWQQAAGIQPG